MTTSDLFEYRTDQDQDLVTVNANNVQGVLRAQGTQRFP